MVWSAVRARRASSTDVQAMRRRVRRAHPRRARRAGRSSSAPAGCATSSSPSSCCSWCTAAPTRRCAAPTTLSALAHLTQRRVRRTRRRRRPRRGLPVPAHARAPDAAARSCAAPTSLPEDDGVAAPAGPLDGAACASPSRSSTGEWRRHSREVRRLHEKLFYRPLLAAVARLPRRRGAAVPGGRRAAARRARLRRPGAALRHLEALTSGVSRSREHPAHAAAGDARLVRRRARTRTPGCSASGRSPRRSARRTGTSRRCATRGRSPSGWPRCWPPAATPPTCCSARPRGCGCSPPTRRCGRWAARPCRRR